MSEQLVEVRLFGRTLTIRLDRARLRARIERALAEGMSESLARIGREQVERVARHRTHERRQGGKA